GVFYPEDLPQRQWFDYYAKHFDTVEINNSFYGLPSAETFSAWRKQAPPGFLYGLKFSRYGSHLKRLKDPRATIKTFLQPARRLGRLLGPILVQLPPNWRVDADRLTGFLRAAPRAVRWVLEFRDASWLCEEIFTMLQNHNAALCIHDMIKDHPLRLTADWVYMRFHGDHYGGSYAPEELVAQAGWIKQQLAGGKDVFAYFNNDAQGYAVKNAAARTRGSTEVVVSFFGDGGANQGVVHESMNIAGVWKLPVIYVCENNQYAMTVSLEKSVAIKQLSARGAAYGFEGKTIDGNDVESVYEATQAAVAKARNGGGATFLECLTYRWDGHFGGDPGTGYRSKEEIESWKLKCPIKRLSEKLIQQGALTEEEFATMSTKVYAELEEVAKRAEAAPLPKKAVDLSSIYASPEVSRG
ncbi:MAG: DUF72 domain-containing protein, partial [Candidatus Binatia bacterium]